MNTSVALNDINSIAQILALGLAGAFFLYRMVSGYFVVDLSLTLSLIREPHHEHSKDHLVVVARVKRGERGSLRLHDAKARITFPNGRSESNFLGIDRVSFRTGPTSQDEQAVFGKNTVELLSGDDEEKAPPGEVRAKSSTSPGKAPKHPFLSSLPEIPRSSHAYSRFPLTSRVVWK